jgi:hypothetical protein
MLTCGFKNSRGSRQESLVVKSAAKVPGFCQNSTFRMDPVLFQLALNTATYSLQGQMASLQTQMDILNQCDQEDKVNAMVQCDKCNHWFHTDCLSLTAAHAEKASKVFCNKCRGCTCSRKVCGKDLPDEDLLLMDCFCTLGPAVEF